METACGNEEREITSSLSQQSIRVATFARPKLSWLVPPKKLRSWEVIAQYNGPLLQSHGTVDQTIPFSLGEKIFKHANEPKEFVKIELADHNDWLTEAYVKKLDQFIRDVGRTN